MENRSNSCAHATASEETHAPALGSQGAGEKWTTGQSIKAIKPKTEIRLTAYWQDITLGRKRSLPGNLQIEKFLLLHCLNFDSLAPELRPSASEMMILYYSSYDKRQGGVGYMVDSRTTRSVIAFQPYSNRLCTHRCQPWRHEGWPTTSYKMHWVRSLDVIWLSLPATSMPMLVWTGPDGKGRWAGSSWEQTMTMVYIYCPLPHSASWSSKTATSNIHTNISLHSAIHLARTGLSWSIFWSAPTFNHH